MTPEDRVRAIAEFGFTPRQARFLVLVLRHSGVCLPRQYATLAGIVHGEKTRAFFRKLVNRASSRRPPARGDGTFPDRLPIGIADDGRAVLLYLVRPTAHDDFSAFLRRHTALLGALPFWTLRLVLPQTMAKAYVALQAVIHDEWEAPLHPHTIEELRWYFERRRAAPNPKRRADAREALTRAIRWPAGWFIEASVPASAGAPPGSFSGSACAHQGCPRCARRWRGLDTRGALP